MRIKQKKRNLNLNKRRRHLSARKIEYQRSKIILVFFIKVSMRMSHNIHYGTRRTMGQLKKNLEILYKKKFFWFTKSGSAICSLNFSVGPIYKTSGNRDNLG